MQHRPEPRGIQLARAFTGSVFEDSWGTGRHYAASGLEQLFKAVVSNPSITTAKLQSLMKARECADFAIKAFASGLPSSNIVAVNLGEYVASFAAWEYLLKQIRSPSCILGHLYITEPGLSGLTSELKAEMIRALRGNRLKSRYEVRVFSAQERAQVCSAKPWFSPKPLCTICECAVVCPVSCPECGIQCCYEGLIKHLVQWQRPWCPCCRRLVTPERVSQLDAEYHASM